MLRYLNPVLVFALLVAACLSGSAAPGDQPISRLPAMTNTDFTLDDLFVMVDDPNGTPVTKKITAGNVVWALTNTAGLASSNSVYALSNNVWVIINASNAVFATFTNSGKITTNAFALSSVESFSQASEQRVPNLGIDLFHGVNGADWTDLEASNYMTILATNGLVPLGWKLFQLTDGLWGTRTNLHLKPRKPPTQANPHDVTNLIKHALSLGIIPQVYGEPNWISSCSCALGSGGPTSPITNALGEFPLTGQGAYTEIDAADWVAMGFGAVQWDIPGGGDMDYHVYHARKLVSALRANSPTRAILVRNGGIAPPGGLVIGGGPTDPGTPGFDPHKIATVVTQWRGNRDSGSVEAGLNGYWKQAVFEFQLFAKYGYVVGPGHNWYFDVPWWNGLGSQQGTNITKGCWAMWAMLPSDILNAIAVDPSDAFRFSFVTNRAFLAIHQDPLVIPAVRIVSNATTEVWSRPLVGGSFAVMFLNTSTNESPATTNVSLSFTNMGFYGNQTIGEYDVWNNTFTQTVSGMTVSVPFQSASLFIVAPLDTSFPFSLAAGDRNWRYNQDTGGQTNVFSPVTIHSNAVVEGTVISGGLVVTNIAPASSGASGSSMIDLRRNDNLAEEEIRFNAFSGAAMRIVFNHTFASDDGNSFYMWMINNTINSIWLKAKTNGVVELRTNVLNDGPWTQTTNALALWPTAPPSGYPGSWGLVNSNGTPYVLLSGVGGSSWTSTNILLTAASVSNSIFLGATNKEVVRADLETWNVDLYTNAFTISSANNGDTVVGARALVMRTSATANGRTSFTWPSDSISGLNSDSGGVGSDNAHDQINWAKPFWMTWHFSLDTNAYSVNAFFRTAIGFGSGVTSGLLDQKGFGWQLRGSTGQTVEILGHNGTSLSTNNTTVSIYNSTVPATHTVTILSRGDGVLEWWIDHYLHGVTGSIGPTVVSTVGKTYLLTELNNGGDTTSNVFRMYTPLKLRWGPF
jgi:hypothetical protein